MRVIPILDTIKLENLQYSELFTLEITNDGTFDLFGNKSRGYKEDLPKSHLYFKTEYKSFDNKEDNLYQEYNDYDVSINYVESGGEDFKYHTDSSKLIVDDGSKYYTEILSPNQTEVIKCSPFRYNGIRGLGKYKVTFYVTYLVEGLNYIVIGKSIEFDVKE